MDNYDLEIEKRHEIQTLDVDPDPDKMYDDYINTQIIDGDNDIKSNKI